MRKLISILMLIVAGTAWAAHSVKDLEGLPIDQDFPVKDLTQLSVLGSDSLPSLTGKPFVVVYWASWCPHCRKQVDYLGKLQKEFKGFKVVGVAGDKDKDKAIRYAKDHVPFPSVFDEGQQLYKKWGIRGVPVTVIVDKRGKISDAFAGETVHPGNPLAAAAASAGE